MKFKYVCSFLLTIGVCGLASADWKLIKTYGDEKSGTLSIFLDYSKIERKQNLFVPVILNRSKPSPIGALSERNLLEIDCLGKKFSQVEGGSFLGSMATGAPASDGFGPLKYGPVPFKSWTDINDMSPDFFKQIFHASCLKN